MSAAFTWDPAKARSNLGKHSVSFEDATAVFDDPLATYEPSDTVEGEARWRVIGVCRRSALLFVIYATWDEEDGTEIYRIISAREATRRERVIYEQDL